MQENSQTSITETGQHVRPDVWGYAPNAGGGGTASNAVSVKGFSHPGHSLRSLKIKVSGLF